MTTLPVLILDNGAHSIKAGISGVDWEPRFVIDAIVRRRYRKLKVIRIYPNSIARSRVERKVFVGDEIHTCRDLSGIVYRRPFEKVRDQEIPPNFSVAAEACTFFRVC